MATVLFGVMALVWPHLTVRSILDSGPAPGGDSGGEPGWSQPRQSGAFSPSERPQAVALPLLTFPA